MKAIISIQMNGAAFEGDQATWELAEILRDLAKHIVAGEVCDHETTLRAPLFIWRFTPLRGNDRGDLSLIYERH